ncbi:hypothetical protein ACIU4M_00520 [Bacillus altitudinis]|uniref:hypothetical protein n=1 Tax=Bacillus altitudinis TaxID=293387 RepID=UPI003899BB68
MRLLDEFLLRHFSYVTTVRLEELITWTSGMALGVLICLVLVTKLRDWIRVDYELKSPSMIMISKDKRKWVVVNPQNTQQTLEAIFLSIYWRFKKVDGDIVVQHERHDFKRMRIILALIFILMILFILTGFWLAMDVMSSGSKYK